MLYIISNDYEHINSRNVFDHVLTQLNGIDSGTDRQHSFVMSNDQENTTSSHVFDAGLHQTDPIDAMRELRSILIMNHQEHVRMQRINALTSEKSVDAANRTAKALGIPRVFSLQETAQQPPPTSATQPNVLQSSTSSDSDDDEPVPQDGTVWKLEEPDVVRIARVLTSVSDEFETMYRTQVPTAFYGQYAFQRDIYAVFRFLFPAPHPNLTFVQIVQLLKPMKFDEKKRECERMLASLNRKTEKDMFKLCERARDLIDIVHLLYMYCQCYVKSKEYKRSLIDCRLHQTVRSMTEFSLEKTLRRANKISTQLAKQHSIHKDESDNIIAPFLIEPHKNKSAHKKSQCARENLDAITGGPLEQNCVVIANTARQIYRTSHANLFNAFAVFTEKNAHFTQKKSCRRFGNSPPSHTDHTKQVCAFTIPLYALGNEGSEKHSFYATFDVFDSGIELAIEHACKMTDANTVRVCGENGGIEGFRKMREIAKANVYKKAYGNDVVYYCIRKDCEFSTKGIIDMAMVSRIRGEKFEEPLPNWRECMCGINWCSVCMETPYHAAVCKGPVDTFINALKLNGIEVPVEQHDLDELRKQLKPCPSCGVIIYKADGCSHMQCGKTGDGQITKSGCGTHFCWICNQVMDRTTIYEHRCPTTTPDGRTIQYYS